MSNLSPKFTPTDYESAKRIHDAHGDIHNLCYATEFVGSERLKYYAILHHGTTIVMYRPNGDIVLNANGWASRTTADRMHRFTPANVRVNNRKGTLTVTVNDIVVGDATYGITIDGSK
jgi:hypothetical protein